MKMGLGLSVGCVVLVFAGLASRSVQHQRIVQEARARNTKTIDNVFRPPAAEEGSFERRQALVFGGTSGIGRAMAERLAEAGASVSIVGRNEAAGSSIVQAMEQISAASRSANSQFKAPQFEFIKADLSIMSNGAAAVDEFVVKHGGAEKARLDYLVFCQTKATLQGYTPTKGDNIDEKLALNFYSRVFLSELLMPILQRTSTKLETEFSGSATIPKPRVMTVLSAGKHSPYQNYESDPHLSAPSAYSQKLAADITSFYSDVWMDKASEIHPEVEFVHVCPGFVETNWGTDMPTPVRWAIRGLQKAPLLSKTAKDCAELLLPGLIDPELSGGYTPSTTPPPRTAGGASSGRFFLLDEFGKQAPKTDLHQSKGSDAVDRVWKDTIKLLSPMLEKKAHGH